MAYGGRTPYKARRRSSCSVELFPRVTHWQERLRGQRKLRSPSYKSEDVNSEGAFPRSSEDHTDEDYHPPPSIESSIPPVVQNEVPCLEPHNPVEPMTMALTTEEEDDEDDAPSKHSLRRSHFMKPIHTYHAATSSRCAFDDTVRVVAIPDGVRLLAAGFQSGAIEVIFDGMIRWRCTRLTSPTTKLAWSKRNILAAANDHTVRLFRIPDYLQPSRSSAGMPTFCTACAPIEANSPHNDFRSVQCIWTMTKQDPVALLLFSPTALLPSRMLLCGDKGGILQLIDVSKIDYPQIVETATVSVRRSKVSTATFSETAVGDAFALIVGDANGYLTCFKLAENKLTSVCSIKMGHAPTSPRLNIQFVLESLGFSVGTDDGKDRYRPKVIFWDTSTSWALENNLGRCLVWCADDIVRLVTVDTKFDMKMTEQMPVPDAMCICVVPFALELTLAIAFPDQEVCMWTWPQNADEEPKIDAVIKGVGAPDNHLGGNDVVSLCSNSEGVVASGTRAGLVTMWVIQSLELPDDSVAE